MSMQQSGRPGGQLGAGVMPQVLRDIYVERKTGLLSFVRGWERRSVRFISGNLVHADTNAPGGHLGDLMVRHGLLQREDLSRALALARRAGKRLGAVLVEEGMLERALLDDAVELHVADTLVQVFAWQDGDWEFEAQDAEAFKGYDLTLEVSTGDLILQAVRSVDDPDVVRYCLGDVARVLSVTSDPLLRFQRVKLDPEDAFLLSRVDGVLSARQVLALAPGAPERSERALFGLLCLGLVEHAPAAAPQEEGPAPEVLRREILAAFRSRERNHFEVLGVPRSASEADVRAAFGRLVQRLHADVRHAAQLADLKPQIEGVLARLAEAYKVLSDPGRRAVYESTLLLNTLQEWGPDAPAEPAEPPDPMAEAQRAEELLSEAEALFSQGLYWDAMRQCEDLLPLSRGRSRRRARVLLAECYLKNPHWRKQAEEELLAALREDLANHEACLLLGHFYKQEGLPRRAASMFRKVLELRPRNAVAVQELTTLPSEGAAEDRSLFEKLLGERRTPS